MSTEQPSMAPISHNIVVTSPPANQASYTEASTTTSLTTQLLSTPDHIPTTSSSPASLPLQPENTQSTQHGLFIGYQQTSATHSGYLPVAHTLPPQHTHSLGGSVLPYAPAFDMSGLQRALPGVNATVPGPAPVYSPIPPKGQPGVIATQMQPPHNRYSIGASPAAVAYQLSQQMQQPYQVGTVAGVGVIQTSEPTAFYASSSTPYQTQPGIYYDQYGRQFPVHLAHGSDPPTGLVGQHPAHNTPTPSGYPVSFPPNYVTAHYTASSQPWYPVPGSQQPPGSAYVYVPTPQPSRGYPVVSTHQSQDPNQRRHSAPIRSARMQNRAASGSPSGSGIQVNPPTAPKRIRSHHSAATLNTRTTTPSGLPRGPPRKPKQSGFAVWVGNLAVGANINDVKEHFANDFKHEILSVKMMPKTDCAFINYRTEKAASEALEKFNESRLHGKKLVVRTRRTVSEKNTSAQASGDEEMDGSTTSSAVTKSPPSGPAGARPKMDAKDRYFIIKSLTVEDLEMSVRTGVWATQAENEKKLNQAYEAAENVYLVFSANRSGEYFGYARMASPIAAVASDSFPAPVSAPVSSNIPTPAASLPSIDPGSEVLTPETDAAPRGRIVDDRDTLFWEILTDDEGSRPPSPAESSTSKGKDSTTDDAQGNQDTPIVVPSTTSRGNPFRVTWMSTKKVPFHLTRGLRNQLNSNREIKIARDATEVDEMAGRRLLQMFGWNGRRPIAPPAMATQPQSTEAQGQQQPQEAQEEEKGLQDGQPVSTAG